jgi:hypothetical protein
MTLGAGTFVPGLWAAGVLEQFKRSTVLDWLMDGVLLSPSDLWNGQSYDEACAFAAVAKVLVVVPASTKAGSFFRLSRSGCPPQPVAQCSPDKLIEHIKAYASKYNSVEDPE